MKQLHFISSVLLLFCFNTVNAQIISSGKKSIYINTVQKKHDHTIKHFPNLRITEKNFIDDNADNVLNGNENAYFRLVIKNQGSGNAENVIIKTVELPENPEIRVESAISVGDIFAGQSQTVTIPVKAAINLKQGKIFFRINVVEKNGFDALPVEFSIRTRKYVPPDIIVADVAFTTKDGSEIDLNKLIGMNVLIQNIGKGTAENVKIKMELLNENSFFTGESNEFIIQKLMPGKAERTSIDFIATRRYEFDSIPIKISILNKKYQQIYDTVVLTGLNEKSRIEHIEIYGNTEEYNDVKIASLTSDVDRQIPVNESKNQKRFALIIGNEDYSGKQKGLSNEANVVFARDDARVFAEYAEKTLGILPGNIFLLTDATAAQICQHIEIASKIVEKTDSSELIFYYAGHGLPDDVSKEPYIIPVDVSGTNLASAIKLSDIYKRFGETGATRITVFLDACFSGGGRESGLLAARALKIKPKYNQITKGNIVVFAASSNEQTSMPYTEKLHGMFTYYLMKAIKETKGKISYYELMQYLEKNVSIASLKINKKDQEPQILKSNSINTEWKNWILN